MDNENKNNNFHKEHRYYSINNQLNNTTPNTSYFVDPPQKTPKRRKSGGMFSYFVVALIAALIGGFISAYIAPVYLYGNIIPFPKVYEQDITENGGEIKITPRDDINTVTAVAKKATKSVVGITTIEVQRDFFWGTREVQGVGSGVIVDRNGYILTNSHVVGDGEAKLITVLFEDGSKETGRVLWNDSVLDLAIVKVDSANLSTADLGDSDELQVGELVVAIGNPLTLDLQRTVTSGIISGLNRTIRIDQYNSIDNLIQTDASINPGNSGGPLLNSEGQVIGINTAKITSGEGLGFAIPINLAKPIIEQVINEGKVSNVYMGIVGIEVEVYEARLGIELNADEGVIIIEIVPQSPAYFAGLQTGDIIQSLDGEKIDSMNTLKKTLYKYNPGDKGILEVLRNGETKNIEITFAESPEDY